MRANPYPMMFSHQYVEGDNISEKPELDECYQGETYQYFSKEEHFYNDSNFYGDPFEEEDPLPDFTFNPLKRSSSHEILGVDSSQIAVNLKSKRRSLKEQGRRTRTESVVTEKSSRRLEPHMNV